VKEKIKNQKKIGKLSKLHGARIVETKRKYEHETSID
jgi:hypothetical protein